MTAFKNNAPTMTPQEIALWEQRLTSGRLLNEVKPFVHGTRNAYKRGKCRCEPCRAAMRAYEAKYRAENRERINAYNRDYRARKKAEAAK